MNVRAAAERLAHEAIVQGDMLTERDAEGFRQFVADLRLAGQGVPILLGALERIIEDAERATDNCNWCGSQHAEWCPRVIAQQALDRLKEEK